MYYSPLNITIHHHRRRCRRIHFKLFYYCFFIYFSFSFFDFVLLVCIHVGVCILLLICRNLPVSDYCTTFFFFLHHFIIILIKNKLLHIYILVQQLLVETKNKKLTPLRIDVFASCILM